MPAKSLAAVRERVRPMIAAGLSDFLARFGLRLVARPLFRIRILGSEHIPSHGPALLVSNHLTYLDGFLIGSCMRPVVRFLVWKPIYDQIGRTTSTPGG